MKQSNNHNGIKQWKRKYRPLKRTNPVELTTLPKGQKSIWLKWVFKTKLKENGHIDKYKARLIAKGYKQEYDVDYVEVCVPVAKHDTIRMILGLASCHINGAPCRRNRHYSPL